ncbi:MAG: hypothetical protein HDR01_06285 [Lachnospiraceae bacterium]|nr:hypothetical protein [Lachnospiraceae bacterium]
MKCTGKYKEVAEQFWKDGCDEYTIEKFIKQEMEADEFRKGEELQILHLFGYGIIIQMKRKGCGYIMRFVLTVEMHHSSRDTICGRTDLV